MNLLDLPQELVQYILCLAADHPIEYCKLRLICSAFYQVLIAVDINKLILGAARVDLIGGFSSCTMTFEAIYPITVENFHSMRWTIKYKVSTELSIDEALCRPTRAPIDGYLGRAKHDTRSFDFYTKFGDSCEWNCSIREDQIQHVAKIQNINGSGLPKATFSCYPHADYQFANDTFLSFKKIVYQIDKQWRPTIQGKLKLHMEMDQRRTTIKYVSDALLRLLKPTIDWRTDGRYILHAVQRELGNDRPARPNDIRDVTASVCPLLGLAFLP